MNTYIVTLLVDLVTNGVLASGETGASGGIAVFRNRFVGLVGSFGGTALDGLRDVVGSVPGEVCVSSGW